MKDISLTRRAVLAIAVFPLGGTGHALGQDASATAKSRLSTYFDAINHRDFTAAFAIWEHDDNGVNLSGQTLKAFADGFRLTKSVAVAFGDIKEPDGAAGALYQDIPVKLTAITTAGNKQSFSGIITMRARNTDGDLEWRIYRASLKRDK